MINENDDIRKAVLKEFGTPKMSDAPTSNSGRRTYTKEEFELLAASGVADQSPSTGKYQVKDRDGSWRDVTVLSDKVAEGTEEKPIDKSKLKSFGQLIQESMNKASESQKEEDEIKNEKRKEVIANSNLSLTKELLEKLMR